jgi:YD repeat-containing protein
VFNLRRHIGNVFGVLALAALVVPPTVTAGGLSVRAHVMQGAAPPVGGAVTQQELPGCSNPSEPFAGASQGCADSQYFARGPRQTTSLDGTFNRGPRQTTSLDGSFVNPETGALSLDRHHPTSSDPFPDPPNAIAERGPDLNAEPTYNSALASTSGVMGYGWSFPYSMSLRIFRGKATITQEDGSQVVFKLGADKRFHAAPRVIASFAQTSGGSYTLTRGSSRSTCPSYLLQSCEQFTFSNGKLRRETTVDGMVTIARDSKGRPTSATADSGDSLKFGYTSGRITSITGPGGVSEHFTYDSHGNLASATDPNGNTKHYGYDKMHRLTRGRDSLGRTTGYVYDSIGRVTSVTDGLGNRFGYAYYAKHRAQMTSPEGRRVVVAYQDGTVVDLRAVGPASGPPLAEWTFAYDPRTLAVTKTVDPNLHVTTVSSDSDGMPLAVTDALGNTTTFTYNDIGRRSSVTDPMGVKTKLTYDENGEEIFFDRPALGNGSAGRQIYSSEYDDPAHPGDMTASIDPLGNETVYTYDSRGNPASVTDPLGNTWKYSIKKACFNKTDPRVARRAGGSTPDTTITDPLGHMTSYTCDANGNLLTTTDATGATTTNTYDADNELTSTTDPVGRKTTTYSYDADGQLTAVHMPDGTTSQATYGADGEITAAIDPAGGRRAFTYDALGRTATVTDQLGRKMTFAYDAADNLTSSTDAMGVTTTNTYDADNQLLSTSFSDGATPTVSYTYDADGRRTSMTDGTGTTTYQYDSLGQLTQTVDGSGASVASSYDLAGDRTSLQYPNGHTVTRQYDGDGQMSGVTDWLGNTVKFQYDKAGNLTRRSVNGGNNTNWAFGADDRILHIIHDSNGTPYATFDYKRAADGRITSVHTTGLGQPDQSYTYDAKTRLGSENTNLLSFDSRDNITRLADGSTLSYDAADQLVSSQAGGLLTSYKVNGDGERTGSSSAAQSLSYGWNGAGDLTSFADNGTTTTYTVNGDGQRVSSSGGGVTHSITWDEDPSFFFGGGNNGSTNYRIRNSGNINTGLANSGSIDTGRLLSDGTNSFIYGPDGLPIEQIDNAGNALFLDEDAQGSVRLLTDAAGNVQGTASYDAFGNQTAESGATSPFGYDGMYLDAESGLYAMSGTPYDPATGQSLSRPRDRVRIVHQSSNFGCGARYTGDSHICTSARYTGDSHICTSAKSVQWEPHKSPGLDSPDLRCGDGIDESCQGNLAKFGSVAGAHRNDELRCGDGIDESCQGGADEMCVLSPYAAGGGDPVNRAPTEFAVIRQR